MSIFIQKTAAFCKTESSGFCLSKNRKLCLAAAKMQGGARGSEARLELDQMPRKALHSKACGERSEDFRAAKQNENLALFRAVRIGQPDFSSFFVQLAVSRMRRARASAQTRSASV